MYSETKRLEFLDSIRGLAAVAVLLSHTIGVFKWPTGFCNFIELPGINIFFDGKAAVAMFFVLSGFVLSRPYLVTVDGRPPRKVFLPTFYLRRITRIWLPWFFAFCASVVAQRFFFHTPATVPPVTAWFSGFWQAPLNWGNFFRQCIFVLHDGRAQLLNQDWSLGVELKGSALIPLFLLLVSGWRVVVMGLLGLALMLVFKTGQYYVSFMVGVLIAKHMDLWVRQVRGLSGVGKFFLLMGGFILYETSHVGVDIFGLAKYWRCLWVGTAAGCGLLLLACLSSRRIQGLLNHSLPVFLGRISYSVYLLQFIVILCVLPPLVRGLNLIGITQPFLLIPLTVAASVLVTIAASVFSFQFVEKPCIALGHKLTTVIQNRLQKK